MADFIPSHRATTSSRKPGKKNEGTVWVERRGLVQCPDCKLFHTDGIEPGRHAPHWHDGVLVNCSMKPIKR